jgi:class 3 adenylate cyclase/Tfp pilus assembly protein PilF
MNHLFIAILVLLYIPCLTSQSSETDSLWSIWSDEENEDEQRFQAMQNLISQNYLFVVPDSAFILAEKALKHSMKTNNYYWMQRFSTMMGISLSIRGENESALDLFSKAMEYSKALDKPYEIAISLSNLGNVYMDMGNYQKAIANFMEGLKILEATEEDIESLESSYSVIGYVYGQMKDYDNALQYFEKALEISNQLPEKDRKGVSQQNLGALYEEMGEFEKALEYYEEGLKIKEKNNYNSGISNTISSIGNIYVKLKNYEKGKLFFENALRSSRETGNQAAECQTLIFTANMYYELNEINKALNIANQAYKIAMKIDVQENIKDSAELLYKIYKKQGNKADALGMHEQFIQLRDTLNSMENNREIISQQYKYDYEKKEAIAQVEQEKKDAVASAKLQRQKTLRNASLGGFSLMFISTFIFFRQRNKIKKEKATSEKLLLNILPHEVAEELKVKGSAEAKHFDQVSVLFTDFKQFTKIAEKLSPTELVAEIDICFQAFDRIMEKYNIEKIKTIGDAYMAAGGLPQINPENAIDVVKAALDIRDFMLKLKEEYELNGKEIFEIRIGVHSGPVVAGIVGIKKFQYDIWGDTVNAASRMESSGEVGKVNISGDTYELVKDQFNCTYRGKVEAKNKGQLDMYFVDSMKAIA